MVIPCQGAAAAGAECGGNGNRQDECAATGERHTEALSNVFTRKNPMTTVTHWQPYAGVTPRAILRTEGIWTLCWAAAQLSCTVQCVGQGYEARIVVRG